jgi:presenilin-like A22 family membrane protease
MFLCLSSGFWFTMHVYMVTKLRSDFIPAIWASSVFIIAQLLNFFTIFKETGFLEKNHIYIPPQSPTTIYVWPQPELPVPPGTTGAPVATVNSLGPILIYFAAVVIVMGIVLFVVPVSVLRILLRVLFAITFSWAIFVVLIFWLPVLPVSIIAVAVGITWFFFPKIWLHNLVMILAMVSLGAVFGRLISPWTAMAVILVLAIYDFVAVRFGYMVWMAKKMSESSTLPAFVFPRNFTEWNHSLKEKAITGLVDEDPFERKFSILGGGDIGFPLLLVSSVFFGYGLPQAILVSCCALLGIIGAYVIQLVFLKGRAMPALPPVAVLTLIALLIIR